MKFDDNEIGQQTERGDEPGSARGRTVKVERIPWEGIREPGSYLDIRSLELVQIPKEALVSSPDKTKRLPLIRRFGNTIPVFVQLSEDPNMSLEEARQITKELEYKPNF